MNEIAIIEQLPVITERIKEIGINLDKRLEDLKLDSLVCTEETRKSIKVLRTKLGNELKEFESQRKNIKAKINEPYETFNDAYENEIKIKYQNADLILKTKISEVENEIKNKAKTLAKEFFEEYRESKSIIQKDYLNFEEINLAIGLDSLTDKGALVKKIKDAIIEKVDNVERDLETISTMQYSDEILVEYLKHKNLSLAIKDVNDRHVILEQVQRDYQIVREVKEQEEESIAKVEEVLTAPKEEESEYLSEDEEFLTLTFTVSATRKKLKDLKQFLELGGYEYE